MIRFIWQNWWRKKERLILLLVGAFIISAGLTYLIGLSDSNKGTIVDSLQNRWSASYDIVVRPEGSRSITEEKQLLEPNYLSGLSGGISFDQYETIKDISGVDVAAPIAMIGYAWYEVNYGSVTIEDDGIYRKTQATSVNNGIEIEKEEFKSYFPHDVWDYLNKGSEYGVGAPNLDLSVNSLSLLAGIDAEQEAKLIGLDEAVLLRGSSRYFEESDGYLFNERQGYHEFPIIVNNKAFVDKTVEISYERLNLPINEQNANEVMEEVKSNGGKEYLNNLNGSEVHSYTFTGEETFHSFISEMTGIDWETGQVISGEDETQEDQGHVTGIAFKSSPLNYQEIQSPYSNRWPYTYQIVPVENGDDVMGVYANQESFREPNSIVDNFIDLPRIKPNWIGFYDSSQLNISKDPMSELPMETYRPASAELVMDADGQPVNPPQQLKPTGDPYSFLTDPPGMLTTIEAAGELLDSEQPISAIRVKVAGVNDMSEESQEILEQVASEIEKQTGLITDITLGSSPQLALTYVPGINDKESIGWLQQPWVNIGSSISIFRETKMSFSSILASVMIVAVVYVWSSGIVSLLGRRKEFAVLLSIGWRPSQLGKLLFLESTIVGLFVALTSWMMLGFVYMNSASSISSDRFLLTGLFGFIVYLLGSLVPIWMTRRIRPYEAMQSGEISKNSKRMFKTRGIFTMAWSHFVGKWRRSLLSIISIALPTALLALFLYITFQLRGVMYTSLLGEYVAVEIGPTHYVAIGISLIIAILTTAEIIWQNVSERKEEISLLQAIGWRSSRIRRLILAEGIFSGLFASILSLLTVLISVYWLYGRFPFEELGFILLTGLIPVIVGLLGTIIPAERAVRILPNQGIQGNVSNRKNSEKRMKWGLGATAITLLGTFLFAMVQVAPNIEHAENNKTDYETAFSPTAGEVEEEKNENAEEKETQSETVDPQHEEYQLVLEEGQNSQENGWAVLSYSAEEVQEETIEGTNQKKVSIDFEFEILDHFTFDLRPQRNFSLLISDERYPPTEVNITEVTGWEEEKWLKGIRDGKMEGTLTFEIPASKSKYDLLLYSSRGDYGKGILVRFDKSQLDKEQQSARNYLEGMIKAVEENNEAVFMSFQDETNNLFYKEQEVWLRGINQKKEEGWEVSVSINNVTLDSVNKGSLELQINMKRDDQDISNHISYPIKKVNGEWKMNDLPFEKVTDGPINLYYLSSLESYRGKVLADVKEIVDLYDETFDWNPDEINIKLYDSVEEISASAAWPTLYGVAVPFTSLKFVIQGNYEVAYGFIKHEIVHTMLADISNDNAPPFMQEGLAIFISSAIRTDDSGRLKIDFSNTADREEVVLENTEEIKPIANLKDINYTDNSGDIYNVGFLITNYLIQTYGIEKYVEMVGILKEYDIIDKDHPDRKQIKYERAIKALERTYGPLDKISEEYIDFYKNR